MASPLVNTSARIASAIIAQPTLYRQVLTQILRDHGAFKEPLVLQAPEEIAALSDTAPLNLVVVEDITSFDEIRRAAAPTYAQAWYVLMDGPPSLQDMDRLYRRGVRGFLSPRMTTSEVNAALVLAAAGHAFVPRHLVEAAGVGSLGGVRTTAAQLRAALTAREYEVLSLLAHGSSNKAIAKRLAVAESTIKAHVHSMLSKLGVEKRGQAAAIFHLARQELGVATELPQPAK
jgi:DNA-binding NarL/FixJ family response regulator